MPDLSRTTSVMPIDPAQCRSIILFGGTFDPPHVGHLQLPELVRQHQNADAVAYIPAAMSPLKMGQVTPAPHRLAMLRLALAIQPRAFILTDELDRASDGKPSYTVDTLEALRARWGSDVKLRLLIGADQFRLFHRWRAPGRIIELAEPVVLVRPPETADSMLRALPPGIDPEPWRSRLLTGLPVLDVSSTEIRRRAAAGELVREFVAPEVEQYIREHGLYQQLSQN